MSRIRRNFEAVTMKYDYDKKIFIHHYHIGWNI